MIYIFEFKHKIKLGFSTNVDKRAKSVAAAVGEDVLRIYKHQGGKDLEKHLHNVLKEYRTKGEFYCISFDKAVKIVEEEITAFTSNCVSPSIFNEYDTLNLLQGIQAYYAGTTRGLKDVIGNNSYIFNKKKLLNSFTINDLFRLCDKYNLTLSVSKNKQTVFELRPYMIKKKTE